MKWRSSPVLSIAHRRLRRDARDNLCLAAAVFFSMLLISLFVFFGLETLLSHDPRYAGLPFSSFMERLRGGMTVSAVILSVITAVTVRLYAGVRAEENARTLAVLTSVGATGRQRRQLLRADLICLYLPAVAGGVVAGALPGVGLGMALQGVPDISPLLGLLLGVGVAALLAGASLLLILLCQLAPRGMRRRTSVIGEVRRQNRRASEERHGYRESATFRRRSLLRRLAQKSTDYHAAAYGRLSLAFALAILYPAQAVLLFASVGNAEVMLDGNPYDGADTSAMALSAFRQVLLGLGVCFVLLTAVGLLQALLMARAQLAVRRRATAVLRAAGMTEADVRRLLWREIAGVLLRSFVIVLFAALLMSLCYGMVGG